MACTFCAIVDGQLPAARVLEDELCVAFLDTRPLFHGHVLVVPRAQQAHIAGLRGQRRHQDWRERKTTELEGSVEVLSRLSDEEVDAKIRELSA